MRPYRTRSAPFDELRVLWRAVIFPSLWRHPIKDQITELETALNSFDLTIRTNALTELVALADRGEAPCEPVKDVVNLHCHTFFSFNAYGHSPTSLAWLAKKRGFAAVGIVDFDVLDAVHEFLAACDLAGVRGSAGIETRVFIPEFATREINSPGEPGVYYHMGIGFTPGTVPPEATPTLAAMRARADRRNREMAARVNVHLDPVTIDYERDVLPLTPAGNATERHMLLAYIRAADRSFSDSESRKAAFWAEKLGASVDQITAIIGDYAKFSNLVRGKLMKRGGVGYVQPSPEAFPTVAEFHEMIVACGALPCVTWLDGISAGEQAIDELLDLLIGQGAVALNIIPDRNWNIADPEMRALKVAKLHEIVRIAAAPRPPAERRHRDERAGQQAGGRFRRARDGAGQAGIPRRRPLHLRPHGHAAGAGFRIPKRMGENASARPTRTQRLLPGHRLPGAARRNRAGPAAGHRHPLAGCGAGRHLTKFALAPRNVTQIRLIADDR